MVFSYFFLSLYSYVLLFFLIHLKYGVVLPCSYTLIFDTEPANIIEKAESISVTAGDSATLECSFTGTPEIAATWFKNGTQLMSGRKYKINTTHKVTSLKILATEKADSAEYTCEVKNDVGSSSCQAAVTVLGWYQCFLYCAA